VAARLGTLPESGLVARKLAETTRSVIASTEYIAKYGERTTPQELSNHHLVSYVRPSARQTFPFSRQGETQSFTMDARIVVSAADGLAIATDWIFYPELVRGTVRS
jgi:hypothetical protein